MTHSAPPPTTFVIRDLETLRVIADPVRMRIFETLSQATLSPKQLAQALDLPTSKLYYHLNILEQHGLIMVAETVMVANLQEKRYRTTALYLDIDPALLASAGAAGQDAMMGVVDSVLLATRADVLRSQRTRAADLASGAPASPRDSVVARQIARMTAGRAAEFRARLTALVEEFTDEAAAPDGRAADAAYALTVVFYPTSAGADDRPPTA